MLEEFWKVLRELRNFWSWIVASAGLPFLAKLVEISPPWPPAIPVLTSIVTLLALILVYHFLRSANKRAISRVLGIGVGSLFLCSLIYLALLSQFTFVPPGTEVTLVKGFICSPFAATTYPNECPELSERALKEAEWDPAQLWTFYSITIVRLAIAAFWLGSFLLLSVVLASFIVYYIRRPAPRRA
ncbi:hypothetical protein [Sinorhizobium meliloti]|uniref:hypothetical protein n=1 Tax=Rhizobium meliloti TaxID=382 RepID=UPI001296CDAD|nr:hypothetical protein [Sinorhizobium meliloti]MQW55267.1 hypothetical protein [Sinorhizobium meliloti]